MFFPFSLLTSTSLFATSGRSSYPRRLLLLHAPVGRSSAVPPPGSGTHSSGTSGNSFDSNVIMILAVLLCALICALGLNSIVRCALRCSTTRMTLDPFSSTRHNTGGVKKKALRSLPTLTYSEGLKLPGTSSECAICLSEFNTGERVRVLPKCNHGFHVQCIDRWLAAHSSCPTCRRCLPTDLKKTAGCTAMALSSVLTPLDPEDPLFNYRGRY